MSTKRARITYDSLVMTFDGCAKAPNPGPAGAGWCIFTPEGRGVAYGYHYLGPRETNNVAEYNALLMGLKTLAKLDADSVIIRGDSKLVVEQVNGRWKCKAEHLKPLVLEARASLCATSSYKLEHIPRERNTWADKLSNIAVMRESSQVQMVVGEDDEHQFTLDYFTKIK